MGNFVSCLTLFRCNLQGTGEREINRKILTVEPIGQMKLFKSVNAIYVRFLKAKYNVRRD